MSEYLTEQEQIEQLKNWFKQYSSVIIGGIIIALIVVSSYRYWTAHEYKKLSRASVIYDEMLTLRAQHNLNTTTLQADKLAKNYPSTTYGNMAILMLARNMIVNKNYIEAAKQLELVMHNSSDSALRQIARIRLARISLAQNKPEETIKLLNSIDNKNFNSLIEEVKGDAYLSMKKNDLARHAYGTAIRELPNADVMRPLLQMKFDNLT